MPPRSRADFKPALVWARIVFGDILSLKQDRFLLAIPISEKRPFKRKESLAELTCIT